MYERFYNLRERPFSLSPDPDYLYPSRVHKEALGYLRYGIETHAGFVVITGEIGSGKTTLVQTMLRGLDRQTSVSRLVNTMLDPRELIEAVMLDFGLDPGQGRSKPLLLRDLARFLVDQRMAGRLALLVIDEAQNMSLAALEEVRMLSNLETEKSKLIQIALIGQPSLRALLGRPELEQLRQRVTVSYHLLPLEADETAAYINHRLRRAAIGAPLQMARPVTDVIHQHSQGLPRKINVIADAVLLFGYGEDRRVIDVGLAHEVVEELETTGVIAQPVPTPVAPPLLVAPPPPPVAPQTQVAPPPIAAPVVVAAPNPQTSQAAGSIDDRELATREARLAEREQQLSEQRRVLQEGYALLRALRDSVPATGPAVQPRPVWPPARPAPPAPVTRSQAAPPERPVRERRVEAESIWGRVRRGLFGTAKPVFED